MIKKIRIGPIDYKVVEVERLLSDSGSHLSGQIDYMACKISIDPEMSEQKLPVTLWHEIVHGILGAVCIDLGVDEERIVSTLSSAIVQVIRDNPELTEANNGNRS